MTIADHPLVVDLDGTLLRLDLLVESGFAFLRRDPLRALTPLAWLATGKANLKKRLAEESSIDVTFLPYDSRVIAFLKQEKASGRTLILATASHLCCGTLRNSGQPSVLFGYFCQPF